MTRIESTRFYLRLLTPSDATERYLGWLSDPAALKYIATSKATENLAKLENYIIDKISDPQTLFLGIFTKADIHIGNIKFEPLNKELSFAVMGILIGESEWRGRGVSGEVLMATGAYLSRLGIKTMVLGVDKDNLSAIRAYEKIGFKKKSQYLTYDKGAQAFEMQWSIDSTTTV